MKTSRILFITSLYSGIENSILTGNWNPKGMPSFYKLLESMQNNNVMFDCVFVTSSHKSRKLQSNSRFNDSQFFIVNSRGFPLSSFLKGSFLEILTAIFIFVRLIKFVKLNDYPLIYLDRANVILSPFLRLFTRSRVFLRVHGVGELYQQFSNGKFYNYFYRRFCYRTKFSYILSSNDGTPAEKFLLRYTNQTVPNKILTNGVEDRSLLDNQLKHAKKPFKILFLNRLSEDKGIKAIIELIPTIDKLNGYSLTIIGTGKYREQIENLVSQHSSIQFLGEVSHAEIDRHYRESDIYLSFNSLGNLSNTVLEALIHNLMIITFKPEPSITKDIATYEFLAENVYYIDRTKISEEITKALNMIENDEIDLNEFKRKSRFIATSKLLTWEVRINEEIELIKSLMEVNRP